MAHNLAEVGGRITMAYQGETPWHKLGTRMTGNESIDQALEAASLNWNVGLVPMFVKQGDALVEVPNKRAVERDCDRAIIATVSKWYEPIQYHEAFKVFEPAMGEFGLSIESVGALGQGEKAWMLFKLPSTIEPVPGDLINGYGLAITGHDGATADEFRPTPIRVVCQNTLNAAVGDGGSKGRIFSISHAGNVKSQISAATELVKSVLSAMKETGETFSKMAAKAMTPDEVIDFIEGVFPNENPKKDVSKQLAERRARVSELVWSGMGAELAMSQTGGQPNPYAMYQAVTEYFDHVRPTEAKTDAGRLKAASSAVFGTGDDFKLAALKRARQLVAA